VKGGQFDDLHRILSVHRAGGVLLPLDTRSVARDNEKNAKQGQAERRPLLLVDAPRVDRPRFIASVLMALPRTTLNETEVRTFVEEGKSATR